jgi:O-antigen/teichoic acid export membrane protein
MGKSFQKIVLVGFGNIFNAVLGFAFLSATAKILDLESFGKYALLTTLLVAISKLIDFGTNSVFVAKSISTEDKTLVNAFYTLKILLLLIAIPVAVAILSVFKLHATHLLLYFILGLIAYSINYTLAPIFQKMEKFTHWVLLNTLPALIKGVFAVLILANVISLNLSQAFGIFSLSLFASAFLIFSIPKEYKKFRFDLSKIKSILKEAAPAGVSQLIYEGWSSISNSIAKVAKDFSNVGIFSIADKITNILALASVSVFTVLLPKNAYRKKQQVGYDFKEIFMLAILILLSAFVGIFVSKFYILRFLGDKFADSVPLLGFMIFGSAFTAIHTFMEHYFFIESKTKYIMFVNVGKLTLFLILASILTPIFSLKGLAISNVTAAFSALLTTIILITRHQKSKAAKQESIVSDQFSTTGM